jgi:hypothetical protein
MLFLTDLTYGKPSSRVVPACLQVFINCIWQLNVKRYSVEIAVLKQVVLKGDGSNCDVKVIWTPSRQTPGIFQRGEFDNVKFSF